jgi:hypothetical protein
MNLFREAIRTRDRRAIVFLFVVGTPLFLLALGVLPRHATAAKETVVANSAPLLGVKLDDGSILSVMDADFPVITIAPGRLFTLVFINEDGREMTPPSASPGELYLNGQRVWIGQPIRAPRRHANVRLRSLLPGSAQSSILIALAPIRARASEGVGLAALLPEN